MELAGGILQVLGIFIALPALVGFTIVGSLLLRERFKTMAKLSVAGLTCSVNADCPEGYVCRDGVCVTGDG